MARSTGAGLFARANLLPVPAYWLLLLLHVGTWLVLVIALPRGLVPWGVLASAGYLAGFFVSRLAVGEGWRSMGRVATLGSAAAALSLIAGHVSTAAFALILLLLAAPPLVDEATRSGTAWSSTAAVVGAAAASIAAALALVNLGATLSDALLFALAAAALTALAAAYRRSQRDRDESAARYDALLSEYRGLKRLAAGSADAARAEERMSVARRLHDSVGHRLTSLLMQLEVERLNAGSEERRQRTTELRRLAELSLEETRAAVSVLSEDELAGMPALIRLIHNLEVESSMQVEYTVGRGAMSAQLDREPAVALYRAVQEALTNAMRHGSSRRASVKVEAPGGRLLRFEVVNDVAPGAPPHRPGFGLTSMLERVEAAGGQVEVLSDSGKFIVRGSFPLGA